MVAVEHERSDCVTALLWRRVILSGNDGSSSLCFDFFSLATKPKHAVQRINRFCVNSRLSLCGKQLSLCIVRNICIELPRRRLHVVDGESGEHSVDMRRMGHTLLHCNCCVLTSRFQMIELGVVIVVVVVKKRKKENQSEGKREVRAILV